MSSGSSGFIFFAPCRVFLPLSSVLFDLSSPRGLWGRYAVKWEAMLAEQKFLAGDAPSLADVAVYEVLDFAHAACAASGSATCLPSAPSVSRENRARQEAVPHSHLAPAGRYTERSFAP